jgi:hypothetical protein
MADYHTPTVVQPIIPNTDMTPLERLLLINVFDAEDEGDALYFFTELGAADNFDLSATEFQTALSGSSHVQSIVCEYLSERISALQVSDGFVEIDLSEISWMAIFQDIVRRSSTLKYIYVISAFTCTKMRSDGFGGMAILITADTVRSKSTTDILDEFLLEAGFVP